MNQPYYIVIEGNIGSGKTTLARALAHYLEARLVLEEFEANPFLEGFYREPHRYAFSVEMAFLADRYHQLSEQVQVEDLFAPTLIADYAPWKSLIFAQNNLDAKEFNLYRRFWEMSLGSLRKPDLVIYLQRSIPSLLAKIYYRGRRYEQCIGEEYLRSIHQSYESFFRQHPETKVYRVNADEHDFLKKKTTISKLWEKIIEVHSPSGPR